MVTLSAKWISVELLEKISKESSETAAGYTSEQTYSLHSQFDSGCNLKIEDVLCYIGNKNDTKLPYAVILGQEDVPKLTRILQTGQGMNQWTWNREKNQFETKTLLIETRSAAPFSSALPKRKLVESALLQAISETIDENLMTGFDLTIRELMPENNKKTKALLQCLHSQDKEQIQTALKKVIGYGKGLTPSGDDFLQGILFVNELLTAGDSQSNAEVSKEFCSSTQKSRFFPHAVSEMFQQVLLDMINNGYTTDTGVHYYRCALQGLYTEQLLQLANGLDNSKETIQKSINKLLTFGHTSGRDTAAGILAAVKGMKIL